MNRTIGREESQKEISKMTGLLQKDSLKAINAFLECIARALSSGDRVELRDFGILETIKRKRKPATDFVRNLKIVIPERMDVKFYISKILRKRLNT